MTLIAWAAIAIAFIVGLLTWFYYQYFAMRIFMKSAKGPLPLPLIGNGLQVSGTTEFLPWLDYNFDKYGKILPMMVGPTRMIFLADYEAIENVLSSNTLLRKSLVYRFVQAWLGDSLLITTGKKWKSRRRILTPAYHFQILEQFMPVFNKVGDILVEQLKKERNKDSVDVYPYVTLAALDVICETAMGVSVNAQLNKTSQYVQSVNDMTKIIMDRTFSALQQLDFMYKFTENYKNEQKSLKVLHGYTDSVIQSRREELVNKQEDTQKEDDFGTKKRVAFLDTLLQAKDESGQPLSDADIREEVDTFMFAGHDTTASGISFALFEIANNPDVQKKILEEQEEILQGEKRDFTINDLNQMKYLEMVIKETLRLYPSVPGFSRETTEDFKLTKDITVPAGITINVMVYRTHRDPEYFPEPEKFNPDRFLPENNLRKKAYCFVPFSAGPRNCIGQKFAFYEMKATLSKIVRAFELSSTVPMHKLELSSELTLKSANGILIKLKERT